mmetsp:Transcript_2261/g.3547  ORF Transcript_2261/g.3547 Transcript_2261/m.3547 type:complete len:144 (+) Transcript_2261:614-1045(+)
MKIVDVFLFLSFCIMLDTASAQIFNDDTVGVCDSEAANKYGACAFQNNCVLLCGNDDIFGDVTGCAFLVQSACSQVARCCPSCTGEAEAFYKCLDSDASINCDFDCSSASIRGGLALTAIPAAFAGMVQFFSLDYAATALQSA